MKLQQLKEFEKALLTFLYKGDKKKIKEVLERQEEISLEDAQKMIGG